jgi:GT2 family glycosyltransferase
VTVGGERHVAAASVVIPTIGRVDELETTLEALAACDPRADEIVVVDQSDDNRVARLVERFATTGARRVESGGKGVALAANQGLEAASHEVVLFTDDDCTVERSWVETGYDLLSRSPECIFTGRVLPLGAAGAVPTVATDEEAHDYSGDLYCSVLVRSNMVVARSALLAFGAFDVRFLTSAEDDDLCYRWLKAGRCLRYEPSLVVWHRAWRDEQATRARYVQYGREQALFYLKHLRSGDPRVARFLLRDLRLGLRGSVAAHVRGRRGRVDPRPAVARGVFLGLLRRRS